jgi:hypothetical protein
MVNRYTGIWRASDRSASDLRAAMDRASRVAIDVQTDLSGIDGHDEPMRPDPR